jgi:signal transduction histidine kinase
MDDRARIARDLHDHVIQRLFGAGLSLQTLASSEANAVTRAQLMKEVGALDEAIADIRTAIFAMSAPSDVSRPSLRHRVLDLVGDLGTRLGLRARVSFGGPVDLLVAPAVVDDVLAVVREGLTNVAKHANASTAEVSIEIDDLGLTIELRDDGDGVDGTATRSSGTANLRQRAQAHGGAMELVALEPAGTMLRWSVPTAPAEGGAQ